MSSNPILSAFLFVLFLSVVMGLCVGFLVFFSPLYNGKTIPEYARDKCLEQPAAIAFQLDGYTFPCEVTPWPEN